MRVLTGPSLKALRWPHVSQEPCPPRARIPCEDSLGLSCVLRASQSPCPLSPHGRVLLFLLGEAETIVVLRPPQEGQDAL